MQRGSDACDIRITERGCAELRELELYLHIPFCVQKCRYCDFLSAPAEPEEIETYVEALQKEIYAYEGKFTDYKVTSVFFGGGTPSLLSAGQMQRLMESLQRVFQIRVAAEITMEMNPGTVSKEKLLGYKKAGINRLSIGLQSIQDHELRMLGRIHDYQMFLVTYEMARKVGFENINLDLISAIPGQTVASWNETLHTVAALAPEHISAYSLIIEEGTPFYELYGGDQSLHNMKEQKFESVQSLLAPLPDEEEERRMYEMTSQVLEGYGYCRYEISNYAKSGYECRHNLGYWERKEYLGLGIGASSLIDNVRYDHIRDRLEYIQLAGTPDKLQCHREVLDQKAQMEEFMFLGLRKTEGIRKQEFNVCFACPIESIYGEVVRELEEKYLIIEENGWLRLSDRGVDISNYALSYFLL